MHQYLQDIPDLMVYIYVPSGKGAPEDAVVFDQAQPRLPIQSNSIGTKYIPGTVAHTKQLLKEDKERRQATANKQQEPAATPPQSPETIEPQPKPDVKVYTLGYLDQLEEIRSIMAQYQKVGKKILLIDTRDNPWSSKPGCKRTDFEKEFGTLYRWEGECLGNANHNHPEKGYDIHDLAKGLHRTCNALKKGYDVIYMCGCTHDGCHRFYLAKELQGKWQAEFASTYGSMTIINNSHSLTSMLS